MADSEDELESKPTTATSEEMLLMLANGLRPSLILPSVAGDSPAVDVDVDQPLDLASTETPRKDSVCRLRHIDMLLAVHLSQTM